MAYVWFLSYLAAFMLGSIATLLTYNAIINKMIDREAKRLNDNYPVVELAERLKPHVNQDA